MGHLLSRRAFVSGSALAVTSLCRTALHAQDWTTPGHLPDITFRSASDSDGQIREALFFKRLQENKVECALCPRACMVADLERGYCGVRENRGGTYYTLVHSRPCSVHVDPIEKKPMFHFFPGTTSFSLATAGCNVECRFCQNWQISQFRPEQVESFPLPSKDVVRYAKQQGSKSIAFTYSEPVVFYEYVNDTAVISKKEGIPTIMITNGYIKQEPLRKICEVLGGIKIDFKAFSEKFYREVCNGELKPVLEALVTVKKIGKWLEMVTLVIPTLNDSEGEIRSLCRWVKGNLGKDVPIHFTRFHPTYKIKNLPPTPVRTLERCREIALAEGLHFVYLGNVPGHEGENTYCPNCKELLIRRIGFNVLKNSLRNGTCFRCAHPIPGVFI